MQIKWRSKGLLEVIHTQSIYAKANFTWKQSSHLTVYIDEPNVRRLLHKLSLNRREREMDRVFYKRRGPEWKQGWTGQALSSISTPPLPLLIIFVIVILLLSISQYKDYKAQWRYTMLSFKLLLFLLPVLLIFFMHSFSNNDWFAVRLPRLDHGRGLIHGAGGVPWGVAILVVVLLVLVSYQSTFHSKWFRPLWETC